MVSLVQRLVFPILVLLWGGYFLAEVLEKAVRAALLIRPVFIGLCLMAAIIIFNEVRTGRSENAAQAGAEKSEAPPQAGPSDTKAVLGCAVAIALYLAAFEPIGFFISTVVFLFGAFAALQAKNKIVALIIAVALTVLLWFLFNTFLGVPLPAGLLEGIGG